VRRLHRLLAAAVLGILLGPMAPTTSQAVAPGWHNWTGTPTGVFRDGTYSRAEFIYSNGIFQAMGANADLLHRRDYYAAAGEFAPTYSPPNDLYNALTYDFFGSHRSTHNGDYQLPQDHARWPDFTADLAELRLAVEGSDLFVRMQFTSFPRPDAQVATLAFAPASGPPIARAWPRNAGVTSRWSTALTLWGTGAQLDTASASASLTSAGGAFRVTDHAFEARVPLADLAAGRWSLTGGSGLDDPASPGRYWTVPAGSAATSSPGSGAPLAPGANVWDLLFARESTWSFDEIKQADDLRGGDVSSDAQIVDPAAMVAGNHVAASLPARLTGDMSRFFTSAIGTGDGIGRSAGLVNFPPPNPLPTPLLLRPPAEDFDITYSYLGKLQPYYMHVPAAYLSRTRPMPLIVYLHGFTGLPDEPFYNPIGLVPTADSKGYLLASALGRGDYSYRGPGDVDVKEVIADVEKHYEVDPNRIYLMGHSMGGYGTNNVGIHNPDLFAAVAPAEGTDSVSLHQNLRNLPWLEMTAEEDLDTLGTQAKGLYGSLSADGYDATLVDYKFKIHEYSSIYDTLPRIFAFFGAHTRNPNPPIVTYSRLPGEDKPALGLVYDHAYWVSALGSADPGKRSDINVESFGIAHATPNPAAATRTDVIGDEGGPTGLPRTLRELFQTTPGYGAAQAVRNAATLTLANVGAISLDLARMGLHDDCSLRLDVRTDHAVAIVVGRRVLVAPAGASSLSGGGLCTASSGGGGGGMPNTSRGPAGVRLGAGALAVVAVLVVATTWRRRARG
jgi:predicted esterase